MQKKKIDIYESEEVGFTISKLNILASLLNLQFTRTVPKFTSPVARSVECTKSILMVWENSKSSVIRKHSVEDGRCFRRDLTAL